MEVSRNLRDPSKSWCRRCIEYAGRYGSRLRKADASREVGLAGSTPSAGKPRGKRRLVAGHIICTHRGRGMMKTQLDQIAKKAKLDPKVRFTSLAHLLTPEFLTETWGMMNRSAASGIDGQTARQFERDVEQQVAEIHKQLKAGRYRAPPVRLVEIPKGPGKAGTRPPRIATS